MLIYCSHKYGGKPENAREAEKIIKSLQKTFLEETFVSPIHAFGFMYNELSYDDGMKLCLDLLDKCDVLLVMSDMSEGVRREIDYAVSHKKHIYFWKGDSELWQI